MGCMLVWFLRLQLFASFKYNFRYDKFMMRYDKLCKLTYDILNSQHILRYHKTWS